MGTRALSSCGPIAIAIATVIAGCGGSSGGSSTQATGTPANLPTKAGGNLVFARAFEPVTFDPLKTEGDNGSLWDMAQIYDQLVEYVPGSLDVKPGLASSWSISSDGLTYTFKLRKARFSNGSAVTAADAKFSVDRFGDPKTNAAFAGFLAAQYAGSTTPNASTLVIRLKRPDNGFLSALATPVASIVPAAVVKHEGSKFGTKPVGSGPFKLQQWVRGKYVKLVRNDNYWKPNRPFLDSVTINYVPNDNTRILQLRSGQADVVEKVPYTQIASLSGQPDVTVPTFPIVAYDAIWLNHKYGPFADQKVRQALNYALNKSAIVKAVYAGKAEVNNSTIAKTKFWSKSVPAYAFDLGKAKQLLATSKYPKGFKLELKVPAGDSVHESIAVIAKDAWSKLGIDVSISQEETNTLFTEYSKGNYQAAIPLPTLTSDVLVPDELALAWLVWTPGYQSFFTQYKSPTVEGLVKRANTTTQESEQATLWPQAQKVSMSEAPWVPLVFPAAVYGVRNNVQNFQALQSGWWDLANTGKTGS